MDSDKKRADESALQLLNINTHQKMQAKNWLDHANIETTSSIYLHYGKERKIMQLHLLYVDLYSAAVYNYGV